MRLLGLLIGVAALPLLIWGIIFAIQNGPTWQVKATPWAILQRMLVEFSVTHRADASTQTWGVLLYAVLAALGVALTWLVRAGAPPPPCAGEGNLAMSSPLRTAAGEGRGAPRLASRS